MKRMSLILAGALVLSIGVTAAGSAAADTSTTTTSSPSNVYYPERGMGRGGWPNSGKGGTIALDGLKPGRFYRASATPTVLAPGLVGYRAMRDGTPVSMNDYAVHRAVLAIQTQLRDRGFTDATGRALVLDGIWGTKVDQAV